MSKEHKDNIETQVINLRQSKAMREREERMTERFQENLEQRKKDNAEYQRRSNMSRGDRVREWVDTAAQHLANDAAIRGEKSSYEKEHKRLERIAEKNDQK